MYNTLQFDQYSRLAIRLDNFRFSAINSKTNLKFEKKFPLVCRDSRNDPIDIQHRRFKTKIKASYSFVDRGTDRQRYMNDI